MASKSTVFVVDDDMDVRQSLTRLFASVDVSCRTFGNAKEFLDAYDPAWSGCLLLDVRMPGMSGIELHEHLVAKGVALPVIIITGHGDIAMAVEALHRGAVSFVEKPVRMEKLLDQIQRALASDEQRRQCEEIREALASRLAILTTQERRVLDGIVAGKSTKQIAVAMELSPKTIDFHRAKVMEKLQAGSIAGLVRTVLTIEGAGEQRSPAHGTESSVQSGSGHTAPQQKR